MQTTHSPAVDGVLGDLVRGSLDHCVKCTICETYCPFSKATPLFPGPKYSGPQAERFRIGDEPQPDASVDYCSSCGICTQVCPQGVKIAEINTRAKARLHRERGIKLRDRIIARPTVLGRLGTPVAPLANYTLTSRPLRIVAERVLGVHRDAAVPRFAGRTFHGWARSHSSPPGTRTVAFFHNCGTDYYEPDVGEKAVAVLEHNGLHVEIPKQGCCGLPLQSNGLFDDARAYVRRLTGALAPYARAGHDIVGPATSCTLMLKREALEILGMEDEEDVRVVSERTYDITEYLLAMHDRGELKTDFRPVPQRLAYHAPCQQQGHNIGKPALDLFALIPELEVVEMDHGCCGIAGTYGLKSEKYEISMKVGDGLFRQIGAARPDVVGCDSETCRWHIEHATGVPSEHPVSVLHRAYGLA